MSNMSNTKQVKNISDYVTAFLRQAGADEEMLEAWKAKANQKGLASLVKKTRKLKDKDKPKRACSAYLYFCKSARATVKSDLGNGAKITEITQELGKRWRELKSSDDAEESMTAYQELAAKDKERYQNEMRSYVAPTAQELKKKRRCSKDKNRPKRARSSYIFFCKDHRQEVRSRLGPSTKVTEVTVELGKIWRMIKASDNAADKVKLAKYERMAQEDRKRYQDEIENYSPSEVSTSPVKSKVPPPRSEIKRKVQPKKTSPKKTSPKKTSPKKAGSNKAAAYRLYVKTSRAAAKKEHPNVSAQQITSILSKGWRGLSEEEKQKWKNKL